MQNVTVGEVLEKRADKIISDVVNGRSDEYKSTPTPSLTDLINSALHGIGVIVVFLCSIWIIEYFFF